MRFVQGLDRMDLRKLTVVIPMLALCTACIGVNNDHKRANTDGQKPDFYQAARLNVEMGEEYLRQGEIARAKQKFIHALELYPKLPEAHTSYGFFNETVGDLEEAEKHYKLAIAYGEGNGRYNNNYGTFLCRRARYDEADREFVKALKDKKYVKIAEVYENAGVCSLKKPDLGKARNYLETAIKRDPSRDTARFELAKLEYEAKNYLLSKSYLESFRGQQKPSARTVWLSYKLNKALDNQDALASDAMRLRNLFPNSAEYKEFLSQYQG